MRRRSPFALMSYLETHCWTLLETDRTAPEPIAFKLTVGEPPPEQKKLYLTVGRVTLPHSYMICFGLIDSSVAFRESLSKLGVSDIKHLQADTYYAAMVKLDASAIAAEDFCVDTGAGPQAIATSKLSRLAKFRLPESQHWGCVTIKGKKT
jgi:hypothetical protein